LDDEDKHVIFKMIGTMLTKKKFKDFFNKNIAAYKAKNPGNAEALKLFLFLNIIFQNSYQF